MSNILLLSFVARYLETIDVYIWRMYGLPKNVCCACGPSECLDAPSICFVFLFLYVGSYPFI